MEREEEEIIAACMSMTLWTPWVSASISTYMYKVLAPSIMTPYKFLWTYGGSGHINFMDMRRLSVTRLCHLSICTQISSGFKVEEGSER